MGNRLYEESDVVSVANAIRSASGSATTMTLGQMPDRILHDLFGVKSLKFTSVQNYYTENQNLPVLYTVMRNAVEFYNAGRGNWINWDYQDGNNPFKLKVTNGSGGGIVDCSGFVGMVMRGWGFFDSIYGVKRGQANANCTPNDTHKSGTDFQWDWDYQQHGEQLTHGNDASLKYSNYWRVITAADQAAYFASQGRLYRADEFTPRTGDICFFTKKDGNNGRFLNISHVGFMLSQHYYLNATDTGANEGIIVTKNVVRQPDYYARPNYLGWGDVSQLTSYSPIAIPNTLNLFPRSYYNMGKTGSGGGVTYNCADDGTITFAGTRTSAVTYKLVSPWCPLVLPAGTYRLSGFVNSTGTNTVSATHKMWGMRVFGTTDLTAVGSGHGNITGTTWSSNGQNSATRPVDSNDPSVWDIGGGCEFTLSSTTAISVDMYCGGAGTDYSKITCKPVLNKIS